MPYVQLFYFTSTFSHIVTYPINMFSFCLSFSIVRLRETGILNILRTRQSSPFRKRQNKHHDESNSFEGGVQIVQVVPILSLYAVSIILAFFLLILETATAMGSVAIRKGKPQWNM